MAGSCSLYVTWKTAKRIAACKSGFAATEFALLLPIMTMLFFGMLELSDAMTANRRVSMAVNTVADLSAQTDQITPNEVSALFSSIIPILEPADTSGLVVNLISVVADVNGDPVVHWSRDNSGATPYAQDDPYTYLQDDTILDPNSSLIVAEITYPFAPNFTSYFVSAPITFQRTSVRRPRITNRILLCDNSGNNCA